MKCTFIVEKGKAGDNSIVMVDGLQIPKKVLLIRNFEAENAIGYAKVFKENGVVKAKAEIPEKYLNTFPAIGFLAIKTEGFKRKIVKESKLYCIGLCDSPNEDSSILKISEQCGL